MTIRVFTIKTYASMPSRFRVTGPAGRNGRAVGRDAKDAGEAAAIALDWALEKPMPYVIVGIESALAHIPEKLRHKDAYD